MTWLLILFLFQRSDARAIADAITLFGPQAAVAQVRDRTDTYWTRQIGVQSEGCQESFTVLAEGSNTWEAAFAAVPTGIVKGPFAGTVSLRSLGITNGAGFQWLIDGKPLGPQLFPSGAGPVEVSLQWDTKSGAPGIHVLCASVTNTAEKTSRFAPVLVLLDQTKPSAGNTITFVADAPPVASGAPVITTVATPSPGNASFKLDWTKATDMGTAQDKLQYEVLRSFASNMATVAQAEANGVVIVPWTANIDTATVVVPFATRPVYYSVIVKDETGNKAVYKTAILAGP